MNFIYVAYVRRTLYFAQFVLKQIVVTLEKYNLMNLSWKWDWEPINSLKIKLMADYIITHDPMDLERSRVEIIQPDEFLKLLGENKKI